MYQEREHGPAGLGCKERTCKQTRGIKRVPCVDNAQLWQSRGIVQRDLWAICWEENRSFPDILLFLQVTAVWRKRRREREQGIERGEHSEANPWTLYTSVLDDVVQIKQCVNCNVILHFFFRTWRHDWISQCIYININGTVFTILVCLLVTHRVVFCEQRVRVGLGTGNMD